MHAKYLTAREAADYTGLSESYLAKLRMGTCSVPGPTYILIGLRAIRYKRSELDTWMDRRARPDGPYFRLCGSGRLREVGVSA